jgi:hypothetical protein
LRIDSIGISITLKSNHRVNGWGNITIGTTTFQAIRDEGELSIGFKIEVHTYIMLGPLKIPLGWQAFPSQGLVPDQKQREVRYWANGYKFPVVRFDVDSNGDATRVTFIPRNPTSLENNLLTSSAVEVYPNPVQEQVNINLAAMANQITIVNLAGQVVYQREGNLFGSVVVPVQDWSTGVYVLRTQFSSGIVNKKFVVR